MTVATSRASTTIAQAGSISASRDRLSGQQQTNTRAALEFFAVS
jgi:hypothetical protein